MCGARRGWLLVMALAGAPPAAAGDDLPPPPPGLPLPPGRLAPGQLPALPELDRLRPSLTPADDDAPPPPAAPEERGPRRASSKSDGLLGALTGSVAVDSDGRGREWEDPLWKRTWQADQSWRCPVYGPLTVFGQLGGSGEEPGQADLALSGRTGLACKLPLWVAELQLRSGPGVRYTDPLRPDHTREKTDWLVEVQARCPLAFGIGLEYQGTALPALSPLDQDQLSQDLRLALPLGNSGKLRLGARHHWAASPDPRPWSDGMQLYVGLELTR
jgi:hypothetical protein